MPFGRTIFRSASSLLLALAFLVQVATPAFSQSSYSVMACCKRSKANCCCHQDHSGIAKLKAASGCQGACRFGSLSAPADTSFTVERVVSPHLQLAVSSRVTSRRLAVHDRRFDVTRYQRPPPVLL